LLGTSDKGANCKDSDEGEKLSDRANNAHDMSFALNSSKLTAKKLSKSDLVRMREEIEKNSKRAIAEIKFCNNEDEESDAVFDWCSQVLQTITNFLPSRHAKLLLKDSLEDLEQQELKKLKQTYGEDIYKLNQ
jgi:uncharacterized protein with gpF-like domain